jgi:hypothetical protein
MSKAKLFSSGYTVLPTILPPAPLSALLSPTLSLPHITSHPECTSDWKLLRFLRGYHGVVPDAAAAFERMAEFRLEQGVAEISDRMKSVEAESGTLPWPYDTDEFKPLLDCMGGKDCLMRSENTFDKNGNLVTSVAVGLYDLRKVNAASLGDLLVKGNICVDVCVRRDAAMSAPSAADAKRPRQTGAAAARHHPPHTSLVREEFVCHSRCAGSLARAAALETRGVGGRTSSEGAFGSGRGAVLLRRTHPLRGDVRQRPGSGPSAAEGSGPTPSTPRSLASLALPPFPPLTPHPSPPTHQPRAPRSYFDIVLHKLSESRGSLAQRHDLLTVLNPSIGIFQFSPAALRLINRVSANQKHYPESVGRITSCGNGALAVGIWKIIRPWVPKHTTEKIRVLGTAFEEQIMEDFDSKSQLFARYGGEIG